MKINHKKHFAGVLSTLLLAFSTNTFAQYQYHDYTEPRAKLHISSSLFFLQPSNDYISKQTDNSSISNAIGGTDSRVVSYYSTTKPRDSWGFALDIGYLSPYANMLTNINLFHYNKKNTANSLNIALKNDAANISLGPRFQFNKANLRLALAVDYARIERNITLQENANHAYNQSVFQGAGPGIIMNAQYPLFAGLSVNGELGINTLVGKIKTQIEGKETVSRTETINNGGDEGNEGNEGNQENEEITVTDNNITQTFLKKKKLVSNVNIGLGLSYTSPWGISMTVGYKTMKYLNALTHSPDELANDNFSLQGPYAKVQLVW